VDPLPSTEKDIPRLAKSYLNGYFPMLRRAPLEDLPSHLQTSLLNRVEEKIKKFNALDRRLWIKYVAVDRKWINELEPLDQTEPSTSLLPNQISVTAHRWIEEEHEEVDEPPPPSQPSPPSPLTQRLVLG
jgi:hypothetical protein